MHIVRLYIAFLKSEYPSLDALDGYLAPQPWLIDSDLQTLDRVACNKQYAVFSIVPNSANILARVSIRPIAYPLEVMVVQRGCSSRKHALIYTMVYTPVYTLVHTFCESRACPGIAKFCH